MSKHVGCSNCKGLRPMPLEALEILVLRPISLEALEILASEILSLETLEILRLRYEISGIVGITIFLKNQYKNQYKNRKKINIIKK